MEFLPVILNKVQLLSMTVAGIEVVLQHLGVCLIIVPVIVIEAVNGCHYTGAMPAPGAVYENFPVAGSLTTFRNAFT